MSLFESLPKYEISGRNKTLDLSQPHVMGILNVTPDSFSDGGQFTAIDKAVAHCQQMIADGATIIDIGGESTQMPMRWRLTKKYNAWCQWSINS